MIDEFALFQLLFSSQGAGERGDGRPLRARCGGSGHW